MMRNVLAIFCPVSHHLPNIHPCNTLSMTQETQCSSDSQKKSFLKDSRPLALKEPQIFEEGNLGQYITGLLEVLRMGN